MPTYAVTCSRCGKDKWPTLPERPDRYVCALCVSVGSEETARRQERGQRAATTRKTRQRASQDTTEPAA